MKKPSNSGGYIMEIVLILVALIFIKYYFNFDIVAWIKSPGPQKIIQGIWSYIKGAYNWLDGLGAKYIKKP